MSNLQLLWFVLIGILFAGFFFLEGFDFGVGMSVKTLAHNEKEKEQLIDTIGPVWDGNEVWLVTAGGAMFASFPFWYASLFSGYYLVLLFILFALIIRGVSFEFRHHSIAAKNRRFWDWTLSIGSFLIPFLFGLLFTSLVKGMPIDGDGNIHAHFTDYVNVFSVVGGIAVALLSYLHGLNYISLKTEGPLRARARNHAQALYALAYVGLVLFAILLFFNTDFFDKRPVPTIIFIVLMVIFTLIANISLFKNKEKTAFLSSGLTLVSLVAMLFTGLFPRLIISSIKPEYDLLIKNASSTPYTLKIMSIAALTLLPFVLAYTIWSYYIFRKRIKHTDTSAGY